MKVFGTQYCDRGEPLKRELEVYHRVSEDPEPIMVPFSALEGRRHLEVSPYQDVKSIE